MPAPGTYGLYSVRSPFRLASIGEPRNSECPDLGAHTREVLGRLGLSDERIMELARAGAIQLEAGSQEE